MGVQASSPMRLDHLRRGSGDPLVLLHYIGGHKGSWAPILPALAREREVWSLSLPGFGGSLMLRGEEPTPAALARAVAAFMAAQGIGRFAVAGNSTGAGVALELARLGVATSVCAISPVGFYDEREARWLDAVLRATRALCERGRPVLPALLRAPAARRALVWSVMQHGERYGREDLLVDLLEAGLAAGYHPTRRALTGYRFTGGAEVTCPATVAWGEHDRLLLYRPQSRRAREALPQAEHVTLGGCGHIPFLDDPDQVARVVLAATG